MSYNPSQTVKTLQGDIPIEQIKVGDEVLGFDGQEPIFYKVEQVGFYGKFYGERHPVVINDNYIFHPNQSIFVGDRVVHAKDLKIGDELTKFGGDKLLITKKYRQKRNKKNLEFVLFSIGKRSIFQRLLDRFLGINYKRSYYINDILVHNATRTGAVGGGNWTTNGTWVEGSAPTASDDVLIPLTAGNITIDSGAVCRSSNCTGYTGTLTHNSGVTLTIGDGTAGLTNVALTFVAGMTYTLGNATTSAISFVSTSATVQTVDFAGKTTGNVTYNASSNGSWQMTGTHNTGSTATETLTKGTLDVNGQTCSWGLFSSSNSNTRTLTLGAATITITGTSTCWDIGTSTNFTLNAGTSSITFNNTDGNSKTFQGGGKTYYDVTFNNSNQIFIQSTNSYHNLTRTNTSTTKAL